MWDVWVSKFLVFLASVQIGAVNRYMKGSNTKIIFLSLTDDKGQIRKETNYVFFIKPSNYLRCQFGLLEQTPSLKSMFYPHRVSVDEVDVKGNPSNEGVESTIVHNNRWQLGSVATVKLYMWKGGGTSPFVIRVSGFLLMVWRTWHFVAPSSVAIRICSCAQWIRWCPSWPPPRIGLLRSRLGSY